MIRGIGIDAVKISRMKDSLSIPGFIKSVFTANEIINCHGNEIEYYATRFASKEAVYKALGLSIDWRKIETLNKEDGSPYVVGIENAHISITIAEEYAIAICIIEE